MQVAPLPAPVLLAGRETGPSFPPLLPQDLVSRALSKVPLTSEGTCACLAESFPRLYVLSIDPDVQFLASVLPPDTDPAFFEHLRALDCSGVTVRALPEGSLAFPGVSAL